MIYYISGSLTEKLVDGVIVEVNGLGYMVHVPTIQISKLPKKNESVKLFTYHYIREDQEALYGFQTIQDRDLFLVLLSVSGIGPKAGVKILSAIESPQLIQAILQKNLHTLTSVPGVGKKVAERIVLELSDKLHKLYPHQIQEMEDGPYEAPVELSYQDDLTLALKTLGYSTDEIKRALKKASLELEANSSLEDGIKVALKHL